MFSQDLAHPFYFSHSRTIVIGDIHGCLSELQELINLIDLDLKTEGNFLCFAGDFVDRGPNSQGVLETIRELCLVYPGKVLPVLGNHDERYVRYFAHEKRKLRDKTWKNPMFLPEEKLAVYSTLGVKELDWLSILPTYRILDKNNWLLVHAGVEPGKDLDQQDAGKMRHLRYVDKDTGASKGLTKDYLQPENTIYWSEKYELPYNVIHGHHVHDMTKPYVYAGAKGQKIVGVDTGCAYGGVLSAYDIISGDYWSVKPKTVYKEVTHQTKLL